MGKHLVCIVCAFLAACSSGESASNNGNDEGEGTSSFPSEAEVETGRWLVTMNTVFTGSDGLPVGAETPIQSCLEGSNPLTPFLDPEYCTLVFDDALNLPDGVAIPVQFDCQGENDSQDVGEGTLFIDSRQSFGFSFHSTLNIDGGPPVQTSVQVQGERLSECEQ